MKKQVDILCCESGKNEIHRTDLFVETVEEALAALAAAGYDTIAGAEHPITHRIAVVVKSMTTGEPRECALVEGVLVVPVDKGVVKDIVDKVKAAEELQRGEGRN